MKQGYGNGTLTEEQMAQFEKRRELKSIRKREPGPSSADWPGGVIIDLGFDDLMTDIVRIENRRT
jgi:tRNA (guanine9-N1)-methyltransferase